MPKPPKYSDEVIAQIVWAPSDAPDDTLAAALGIPRHVVFFYRKRYAEGYVCRLQWRTCLYCGGLFAARDARQKLHPRCRTASNKANVATAHRAKIESTAEARSKHKRWSAIDRAYMIQHLADPAIDVARSLGRTVTAVEAQRNKIRKQLDVPLSQRARRKSVRQEDLALDESAHPQPTLQSVSGRKKREVHLLTDDQLRAILNASDDEPTTDLATRIAAPYFTVAASRRKLRNGQWVCRLYWTSCDVCGQPVAVNNLTHKTHPACIPERERQRARNRRADRAPGSLSTSYVAKWRQSHPERNREFREADKERMRREWHEKPREARLDDLDKAHEFTTTSQEQTKDQARNTNEPWSAEEDQWIIDHPKQSAVEIALLLGRTYYAVMGRRVNLRKAGRMS